MRRFPLLLLLIAAGVHASPLAGQTSGPAGGETLLVVVVTGMEADEGSVRIALFDDPRGFTDEPISATVVRPVQGVAEWTVRVAPGNYAVAAIHDEDDDGSLDTNLLGMPSERYGFSNGARGMFGPPSFDDASFPVEGGTVRVPLAVR